MINDTGVQIEFWAQYGPTAAYGSETDHEQITTGAYELQSVFPRIRGLERDTTYHFRVCARDEQQQGGPRCGEDRTFTTQSVGCGETVTSDLRLTGDLDCPQQAGLMVGADGIDINLAGHSMSGGIFVGGGGPTGIDNSAGYDDVTIRNGAVLGFGFGIRASSARRNRILDIAAAAAGNAVTVESSEDVEIRHSDLSGRSYGIKATGSHRLVVADTSSDGAFGDGIDVVGDSVRLVRNRVVRRLDEFPVAAGIRLVGSGGRIAGNHVQGSWSSGGIVFTGADGVLVDNRVFDATVPDVPDSPPQFGDGIFVGAFSSGVVLRRNRADRNEGDGIEVRASGTKLDANAAFGNGGWGIRAVPGTTDLGGNTASDNGAGQCSNVFCF